MARQIILAAITGLLMFGGGFAAYRYVAEYFLPSISAASDMAPQAPVKILIVPGHTNAQPGAVYKDVRESDLNLALAYYLRDYLARDKRFKILVTRQRDGIFSSWFGKYASKDYFAIQDAHADGAQSGLSTQAGLSIGQAGINYDAASDENSLNLYAVNDFVKAEDVALVLHIHFNSYARQREDEPGQYQGFAIYLPPALSPRHDASAHLAEAIKRELLVYQSPSTNPGEFGGIVESQRLVAVRSSGEGAGPVALVEYGYIYELRFEDPETRDKVLKLFAEATAAAVREYVAASEH